MVATSDLSSESSDSESQTSSAEESESNTSSVPLPPLHRNIARGNREAHPARGTGIGPVPIPEREGAASAAGATLPPVAMTHPATGLGTAAGRPQPLRLRARTAVRGAGDIAGDTAGDTAATTASPTGYSLRHQLCSPSLASDIAKD